MTLEGPFVKGKKSSYVANYRYSSLALLDDAGIIDFGGIPKYQDAAFKMRFPTKNAGVFSVFGFGRKSNLLQKDFDKTENGDSLVDENDIFTQAGIIGAKNFYFINDNTYLETKVSVSNNGSGTLYSADDTRGTYRLLYRDFLANTAVRTSTEFNKKINSKNKIQFGVIYSNIDYLFSGRYLDTNTFNFKTILADSGRTGYLQGYSTWKYRVNDDITIVSGLHYMQLMLNNSYSIEPRIGVKWKLSPRHTINAGFGVHSKIESLLSYFAKVDQADGTQSTPNLGLKLPKANHYVVGYDYGISENAHLKFEAYYQQLYHLAVENDVTSSYANINRSNWFSRVEMVSEGTGKNYGVEMTLERFLSKNFYYLLTASLYESKYTALDGVERGSRYNGNYVTNFLIGKEFKFGKIKKKVLKLNSKVSYIGGNRYTPVDYQQSFLEQQTVYKDEPWSKKGEDIFLWNIGAILQMNRKKTTHAIKFEIINTLNNQSKTYEYFSVRWQELRRDTQLEMIPNILYQVQF